MALLSVLRSTRDFRSGLWGLSKSVAYVESGWCVLRRGQLFRRHHSMRTRLTRIFAAAVKSHDDALDFACAAQLFTALRSE